MRATSDGGSADLPFDRPDVVAGYDVAAALSPAEVMVFDDHVPDGARVLDLGVGAGRTTARLSRTSAAYLGVDIAPNMIRMARQRHPHTEFAVGDATALTGIDDSAYDVVVFSFNGIDYIVDRDRRTRALTEIHRVLRPGGTFVFSSHDPRAVIARRNPHLGARAVPVAVLQTARRLVRRGSLTAIRRGEGVVIDAVHGGLPTFMATPERIDDDLRRHGFRLQRSVPGMHPRAPRRYATEWWYYVARREDRATVR